MSYLNEGTPAIRESKMMDNARTKNRSFDKQLAKKLTELDKQYQLKKSKMNVEQVFLQQAADDFRFNRRPTIIPRGLSYNEKQQFVSLRRATDPIIPDIDTWLSLSKSRREPLRIPRLRKRGRLSSAKVDSLPPITEGPLVGKRIITKAKEAPVKVDGSKEEEKTVEEVKVVVPLETESEPEVPATEKMKMKRSLTFANILTEHEKDRLLSRRSNYAQNYYNTPRSGRLSRT